MRLFFRCCLSYRLQRWIGLLIGLIFILGVYGSFAWLVQAAGSSTLYPNGAAGNRANIEWRTGFYGNNFLRRRTLLKVYAQAGEFILLGSSAVGVNNGDARVYDPGTVTGPAGNETIPGAPNFSCEAQRTTTGLATQGQITSRAEELAGPDTIPASIPNAFLPCVYTVTQTGIHYVVFYGPTGDGSNTETAPTGSIPDDPANFNNQQDTSISSWDVTVRRDLTVATVETGRLFADYLSLFTGSNGRPLFSTLFILTKDGYRYQTDLRGIDPNGFIVYGNDIGFLDSDDTPLLHDVIAATSNQLTDTVGGVNLSPPTHFIFFEPPSDEAIMANGVPLIPIVPQVTALEFRGIIGDNDTFVGAGGTFTYTSDITGIFELIISRDGIDFNPTNPVNRVLRDIRPGGTQTIIWDGLDNTGTAFPAKVDYTARIIIRGGEYHFPLLDVENSLNGGPSYGLLNPPGGTCRFTIGPPPCTTAFYDDRGYTTAGGTDVGVPGVTLPGNGAPIPPNDFSDPVNGFDTTSNQRAFGDNSPNGFGDKKGLDLWTYFPSTPLTTPIDIFAVNLAITKTDHGITTTQSSVITYTLQYTNTSPTDATGVVITEIVPLYTTFNIAASAPTVWNCPNGITAGNACTTFIGPLASGANGVVTFGVTVDASVPDNVTQIDNITSIADDGNHGPEPIDDNSDTEDTPLSILVPDTPTPTPTPDSPTPTPTFTSIPDTPTVTPVSVPPTLTSTPISNPPSQSPPTPSNPDDDDGDEGDSTPLPPVASPPPSFSLSTPLPPVQLTSSPLPVLFLPETGENEIQQEGSISTTVLLLILLGLILSLCFIFWRKSKAKNLS